MKRVNTITIHVSEEELLQLQVRAVEAGRPFEKALRMALVRWARPRTKASAPSVLPEAVLGPRIELEAGVEPAQAEPPRVVGVGVFDAPAPPPEQHEPGERFVVPDEQLVEQAPPPRPRGRVDPKKLARRMPGLGTPAGRRGARAS